MSPLWEVLSPKIKESAYLKSLGHSAKFQTDTEKGIIRVITPDTVVKLAEVRSSDNGPELHIFMDKLSLFNIGRPTATVLQSKFDANLIL